MRYLITFLVFLCLFMGCLIVSVLSFTHHEIGLGLISGTITLAFFFMLIICGERIHKSY